MTDIVLQLQASAVVFGTGTRFRQQTSITDVESVYISGRGYSYTTLVDDIFFSDLTGTPIHNQFAVNIYFGGNYTSGGGTLYGGTLDPEATIDYPLIIINDAGFASGSGADAPVLLNRLTGPHEMAHYLARFDLECFGPLLDRCDDDEEHSIPPLSTLLNPGIPGQPVVIRPLFLPGDRDDPSTERGETYDRVIRGIWNLP